MVARRWDENRIERKVVRCVENAVVVEGSSKTMPGSSN